MRVDGKGAHGPAFFAGEFSHFIRRVEKFMVRMDGEETRARRFGGQLRPAGSAAPRFKAGHINPLAPCARVSAEINEELLRCPGPSHGSLRSATKKQRQRAGK